MSQKKFNRKGCGTVANYRHYNNIFNVKVRLNQFISTTSFLASDESHQSLFWSLIL